MPGPRRSAAAICAALLGGAPLPLGAALANPPHVDIRFISEHLGEAAQDARSFSLPWPNAAPAPGRWRPFVAAGWTEARTEFLEESGRLTSAGAVRGFTRDRALVLFGFYDELTVGGGAGEQVLTAGFLGELATRPAGAGAVLRPARRVPSRRSRRGLDLAPLRAGGPPALAGGGRAAARPPDARRFSGRLRDSGRRRRGGARHARPEQRRDLRDALRRRRLEPAARRRPGARAARSWPERRCPEGDLDGRLIGPGYDRSSRDPGGRPAQTRGRLRDGQRRPAASAERPRDRPRRRLGLSAVPALDARPRRSGAAVHLDLARAVAPSG